MGQYWDLINVDRKEKDLTGGGKLGEFFFTNHSRLDESLRIPRLPKAMDVWLSRGSVAVQPGPMGKLSTEILDIVFEDLLLLNPSDPDPDPNEDFLDCIIFAISCKRLLTIGKRHILQQLISRYARAADSRLVCLGGYAYPPDQAPPGMLTDAELKEIATTPDPDEDSYESVEEAIARRCLYHFAAENYAYAHAAHWRLFEPLRITVSELWRVRRQDPAAMDAFYSKLDLKMITTLGGVGAYAPAQGLEYAEGPRVLCNTSKGEYVREDKLVEWDMKYWRVTLAHALLARVCYSPDDSISMCCGEEYKDALVKGPWAGDRFRIVSVDEMSPLKGGRKWKDVTGEVNELLCHLLEGEFPEEWCKKRGGQKEDGETKDGSKGANKKEDNKKVDVQKKEEKEPKDGEKENSDHDVVDGVLATLSGEGDENQ